MSKATAATEAIMSSTLSDGKESIAEITGEGPLEIVGKTIRFLNEVRVREVEKYLADLTFADEEESDLDTQAKDSSSGAAVSGLSSDGSEDIINRSSGIEVKIVVSMGLDGYYNFEFLEVIKDEADISECIQKILDEERDKDVDLLGGNASIELSIILGLKEIS